MGEAGLATISDLTRSLASPSPSPSSPSSPPLTNAIINPAFRMPEENFTLEEGPVTHGNQTGNHLIYSTAGKRTDLNGLAHTITSHSHNNSSSNNHNNHINNKNSHNNNNNNNNNNNATVHNYNNRNSRKNNQSNGLERSLVRTDYTKAVHKYATTRHPSIPQAHRGHPVVEWAEPRASGGRYTPSHNTGGRRKSRPTTRRLFSGGMHVREKKESSISLFDIETDKVDSYQYRPGEEITGAINIVIRQNLEIRFVELVVSGQGQITIRRSRDGLPLTVRENYLQKQTFVIGSGDGAWTSLLTPGHYTSKFRVKLPPGLPSTIRHEDAANGISLDIGYSLKARICDDVAVTSPRGNPTQQAMFKVLASKKMTFTVQRAFDLSTVPESLTPVTHREQLYLTCTHPEPAILSLNLDRAVFLAGDDVRCRLSASLPKSHRIKEITCTLQQHLLLESKNEAVNLTLSRVTRKEPAHVSSHPLDDEGSEMKMFDVTIPTQTDLISGYSLGMSGLKLSYSVAVGLRFAPAGGKLSFKVPVAIGPCAEPIYAEKTSSRKAVPVFNRPTRFPFFTTPITSQLTTQPIRNRSASSINVTTEYSNSCFSRLFLCCFCRAMD